MGADYEHEEECVRLMDSLRSRGGSCFVGKQKDGRWRGTLFIDYQITNKQYKLADCYAESYIEAVRELFFRFELAYLEVELNR